MKLMMSSVQPSMSAKTDEQCPNLEEPPVSPTSMAFVPITFSRPQLRPPVLCSRRLYVHLVLLVVMVFVLVIIRIMSQVKVTFVHYHMESDADAELVTLPKSFAFSRGAYCLDGSPPAYYYRPSAAVSVNFWIIYLPGGAWCTSEQECFQRSLTELGSSHVARTSLNLDGFLSKNCDKNPDFCLWNVIILHYCDGSSFLGNESQVLKHESQPLYLRGAQVFDTLIEYLITATHLGSAEQIVLAGSSAGGIGALIHADRLRSKLPQSVKTLHMLAEASMFVDTPNIHGEHTTAELFKSLYKLHSIKSSASIQECTQTQKPEEEWTCLLPSVYHNYVFTPMFFIHSIYDTWQRTNTLNINCFAVACPTAHLETVYKTRDAIRELAHKITLSRKNGIFLSWCPLHTMLVKPWFSQLELGNPTLQKSLASWLQHDEGQTNFDVVLDLEAAVEECSSLGNL